MGWWTDQQDPPVTYADLYWLKQYQDRVPFTL
jgi:hypothetical protein